MTILLRIAGRRDRARTRCGGWRGGEIAGRTQLSYPPKRHPSAQVLLDNNYCVTIDRQLERSPISRARSLASAVIGRKGGNCLRLWQLPLSQRAPLRIRPP